MSRVQILKEDWDAESVGDYSAVGEADTLSINSHIIDDIELDIPELDAIPSLQSILDEQDDSDGENGNSSTGVSDGLEDQSPYPEQHFRSRSALTSEMESLNSISNDISDDNSDLGTVVQHIVLRGISKQALAARDVHDAGTMTAIDVSNILAIGMSKGVVLIFNSDQALRWCLEVPDGGFVAGPVSSLSFNYDTTRLLVGHAKVGGGCSYLRRRNLVVFSARFDTTGGTVNMWNISNGKLIRTIQNGCTPGCSILSVNFTNDLTLALCSDSGGSIYELNFTRVMGVRGCKTACVFSGSRGETCCLAPYISPKSEDTPVALDNMSVVAIATMTKLLVIALLPRLVVIYCYPLVGTLDSMPVLSWTQITKRSLSGRRVEPILAFGRQDFIYIFSLYAPSLRQSKCFYLSKIPVSYNLMSLQWLSPQTIGVLDSSERLHIVDVKYKEEVEVVDLSSAELVYGSSSFMGLVSGSPVSVAMKTMAEHACYESVRGFNFQMIMLGMKSVNVVCLKTWKERVCYLMKRGRLGAAINLCVQILDNKSRGMVGVKKGVKLTDEVCFMIRTMTREFLTEALKRAPSNGAIAHLERHYLQVMQVVVPAGVKVEHLAPGHMYDIYTIASEDVVCLGTLFEMLESFILLDVELNLSPEIVKEMVDHYASRGYFDRLEQWIVHLRIGILDLDQITRLNYREGLYDSLFYIFGQGLKDYATPLAKLLPLLRDKQLSGKPSKNLGAKLLVFISYSLNGRDYPSGKTSTLTKNSVWKQVMQVVLQRAGPHGQTYYNLSGLIHHDVSTTLGTFTSSLDDACPDTEVAILQLMIEICFEMVNNSDHLTPEQIRSLLLFIAEHISRCPKLFIGADSLRYILSFLTTPENGSHQRREITFTTLLRTGRLDHVPSTQVLKLAEAANFTEICIELYDKYRMYDKLIGCYLSDPNRRTLVFTYLSSILAECPANEQKLVEMSVNANLEQLLEIDSDRTIDLLSRTFEYKFDQVMRKLHRGSKAMYLFLGTVFDSKGGSFWEPSTPIHELVDQYLELLCEFDPDVVHEFVDGHKEEIKLETAIRICSKNGQHVAVAYLYEQDGNFKAAFETLFTTVNHSFEQSVQLGEVTSTLEKSLGELISLCERRCGTLSVEEAEARWFSVLQLLLSWSEKLAGEAGTLQWLMGYAAGGLSKVINRILSSVNVSKLIALLMDKASYENVTNVHSVLTDILNNYNYETVLFEVTTNIINQDLVHSFSQKRSEANHSFRLRANNCCLCLQPLRDHLESLRMFFCGHTYHVSCLAGAGVDSASCSQCYSSNHLHAGAHSGNRQPEPKPISRESEAKDAVYERLVAKKEDRVYRGVPLTGSKLNKWVLFS